MNPGQIIAWLQILSEGHDIWPQWGAQNKMSRITISQHYFDLRGKILYNIWPLRATYHRGQIVYDTGVPEAIELNKAMSGAFVLGCAGDLRITGLCIVWFGLCLLVWQPAWVP